MRGDAVEDQVAGNVGGEGDAAVTLAGGELIVGVAERALQGQGAETGVFALVLVQARGVEIGGAQVIEGRRLPRIVGDLEAVVRVADQQAETGVLVDQVGQIGEALALMGFVMEGVEAVDRVFQAILVLVVIAADEPAQTPAAAPQRGVGVDGAVGARGDADAAAIAELGPILGGDVDHRSGAVAELCRQCAIEQLEVLDDARLQALAEARDGFGNDHAVDAVLQVGVVAAHVDAAVGILYHARRLQQDLIEWRRRAERQAIDIVSGDGKLAAADVRRQGIACRLELGDHIDRIQVGRALESASAADAAPMGAASKATVMAADRRRGVMAVSRGG